MENKIYPCFWMNGTAPAAARFYQQVFTDTQIVDENPMVVVIHSAGQQFMFLDAGPKFKINASISIYVHFTDEEELTASWDKLMEEGVAHVALGSYDWSPKFGWVEDKYGINWQMGLGKPEDVEMKFSPFFTFTGQTFGRAEEAVGYYTSIFPDSGVRGILKQRHVPEAEKETVLHAQFTLCNQVFMAIDSAFQHPFQFDEGVSLVINCADQKEIDFFWENLTLGGEESMCGWLKDKFGVRWQVVPFNIGQLMHEKGNKAMEALLSMRKIDMDLLMQL